MCVDTFTIFGIIIAIAISGAVAYLYTRQS